MRIELPQLIAPDRYLQILYAFEKVGVIWIRWVKAGWQGIIIPSFEVDWDLRPPSLDLWFLLRQTSNLLISTKR